MSQIFYIKLLLQVNLMHSKIFDCCSRFLLIGCDRNVLFFNKSGRLINVCGTKCHNLAIKSPSSRFTVYLSQSSFFVMFSLLHRYYIDTWYWYWYIDIDIDIILTLHRILDTVPQRVWYSFECSPCVHKWLIASSGVRKISF